MSNPRRRYSLGMLVLSSLTAAVLAAGVTAFAMASQGEGSNQAATTPPTSEIIGSEAPGGPKIPDLARRIDGDPMALGRVDAPVVMVDFSDYRCPFCTLFAKDTLPALIKDYVDTGILRIEWRDLPLQGEQSVEAAIAGRMAAKQGKFWEYQDAVHAGAPDRGHADLPREKLIELAGTAGVPDVAAFEAGLGSEEILNEIRQDVKEAQMVGASGTPFFLIGNEPISGAQPLEVFEQIIQRQAAGR